MSVLPRESHGGHDNEDVFMDSVIAHYDVVVLEPAPSRTIQVYIFYKS